MSVIANERMDEMPNGVRNHDHISFDKIRRCRAVRDISRYTPVNSGEEESLETLLARADEVADGMKAVMQRTFDGSHGQGVRQ